MRTKRGEPRYKLPMDFYRMCVDPRRVTPDGIQYALQEVLLDERIIGKERSEFGAPTHYAFADNGRVQLIPTPDAEYEIKFGYLTWPKEW